MGLTSLHAMGHPTPERMKAMIDEAYNEGMANAQRTMHGAHGGATDIGRGGYNAWTARGGLRMAQMSKATSLDSRRNQIPAPGSTEYPAAVSKLEGIAAEYAKRFPQYFPDEQSAVAALNV